MSAESLPTKEVGWGHVTSGLSSPFLSLLLILTQYDAILGLELVGGFFPASPSRMGAQHGASALDGLCLERLDFPFTGLWRKGSRGNEEGEFVEFKAQSPIGDTSA